LDVASQPDQFSNPTVLNLISGKGRMLLLMYAMFLAMNHPMTNVYRNIGVMSNSITCGQEKALNETKDLIKACVAPMQSLFQATSKHVLVKVRLYTLS